MMHRWERPDIAAALVMLVLALCSLGTVVLAQGPVLLPDVPNGAMVPSPTPQPERKLTPPPPIHCFSTQSANAVQDAAGTFWWTCESDNNHGTCLFRAVGSVSIVVECRDAAHGGGGVGFVTVGRDGYGYWQIVSLEDDHAKRGLGIVPIKGWVRGE
jgi:hypothetical protein